MMNVMTYKGYKARVEYDPRDNIFVGRVLGIEDGISFHGETVADLKERFAAAINHYLADCKAMGRKPEKQVSGNPYTFIRIQFGSVRREGLQV